MSWSEEELSEFKQEAFELLDIAEKSLLDLSQGQSEFRVAYDAAFRAFHSLKGAAGMMELLDVQAHTHQLESLLLTFKEKAEIPTDYLSLFLGGVDATRSLLNGEKISFSFQVGGNPQQTEDNISKVSDENPAELTSVEVAKKSDLPPEVINEFVVEMEELLARLGSNFERMEKEQYPPQIIDEVYRDIHSIKGSAFLFSFNHVGQIAHLIESNLEPIRSGQKKLSQQLAGLLLDAATFIEQGLVQIKNTGSDFELETKVQQVNAMFLNPQEPAVLHESAPEIKSDTPLKATVTHETEQATSIRVPVPLLDNLMTLMGEMVLVRNQVLQFSNNTEDLEFLSMSKRLNVVTNEIQTEMMKTRMQPIGNVISKFSRVVRDISNELKKEIRLQLNGTETELDKSLLETIKDPLTHIVRNSCDHGIEAPEIRKASGKPECGTITIKAYHEGGQVVVEISDDGHGLNKERLLAKAIEKGILNSNQAAKLSEKEIFNLIFAPGFSTAAQVTNLSGRGVGMDVVRTNIEKMGGTVDIASVQGRGTTIKLKIPLTLAIVPALIVRCGGGLFAVPQVKLEELLRVDNSTTENRIEIIHGVPVYRLRGNILPLVDLNQILNIGEAIQRDFQNGIVNIAVLNADRGSFGVIIDEVKDTADIVVKPINRLLKSLKVYSGATILGDGSVALIFDVLGISKVANLGLDVQGEQAGISINSQLKTNDLVNKDYLLVQVNSPTRHAIPLESVHRLEDFKISDVEISGFQRVIRYRERILPLVNIGKTIGYSEEQKVKDVFSVVVIKDQTGIYGLEVSVILDTLSTSVAMTPALTPTVGIAGNLNLNDELIVVIDPKAVIQKALLHEDMVQKDMAPKSTQQQLHEKVA